MSASGLVAMRVSYVHAGLEVFHVTQFLEVHRIVGVWEDLVHFVLEMLVTGRIGEEVIKDGG